jgi:hypothetical protein
MNERHWKNHNHPIRYHHKPTGHAVWQSQIKHGLVYNSEVIIIISAAISSPRISRYNIKYHCVVGGVSDPSSL